VDLEDLTDAELWRRAVAHDGSAFGDLFNRHASAIYNHCFRRTGDWDLSEDLTSIVFLEAWRKRKHVRLSGTSVLPWLLAVANNCVRNAKRSRRRYGRLLAKLPRAQDTPGFETELSERVDDAVTMRRLLDALGDLRVEDQEVVSLCDWAGLSQEEAASALGVPVGTVKSRLSRARERLRAASADADARGQAPVEHGGSSK
jgi:RNA polymerase sigma-70 factor (ECF subfamily)